MAVFGSEGGSEGEPALVCGRFGKEESDLFGGVGADGEPDLNFGEFSKEETRFGGGGGVLRWTTFPC